MSCIKSIWDDWVYSGCVVWGLFFSSFNRVPIVASNPRLIPKNRNPMVKKACALRNGLSAEGILLFDKPINMMPIRIETPAKTRAWCESFIDFTHGHWSSTILYYFRESTETFLLLFTHYNHSVSLDLCWMLYLTNYIANLIGFVWRKNEMSSFQLN